MEKVKNSHVKVVDVVSCPAIKNSNSKVVTSLSGNGILSVRIVFHMCSATQKVGASQSYHLLNRRVMMMLLVAYEKISWNGAEISWGDGILWWILFSRMLIAFPGVSSRYFNSFYSAIASPNSDVADVFADQTEGNCRSVSIVQLVHVVDEFVAFHGHVAQHAPNREKPHWLK